jgi:hypothetical protein
MVYISNRKEEFRLSTVRACPERNEIKGLVNFGSTNLGGDLKYSVAS